MISRYTGAQDTLLTYIIIQAYNIFLYFLQWAVSLPLYEE